MAQEDNRNGTGDLFSTTPAQARNSTPTVQRLIETAAEIMGAPVPTDRDRAFLARQLVQATLPHSDPGDVPVWTRTNGRLTLVVRPYYDHRQRRHLITRAQRDLAGKAAQPVASPIGR
jgi:hypothetical protein